MLQRIFLPAFALWIGLCACAAARTWTDSSGFYRFEADLIGFNDTTAVLKKADHQLTAVPLTDLSKEDRDYLKSKDAVEQSNLSADALQTWTLASGLKIVGRVVDYARKDVTIQQRRGRTYVNDRLFTNLPEVYQRMLPKIVAHFEKTDIDGRQGFDSWVMKLRGEPRTFTCEGVKMELENGDEYGIPFFLFAEKDRQMLQPGWQRWLAADKDRAKQKQESFLLQNQASAYQQDQKINQQIAMMQLQMQGYQAGLFDLWEVRLMPGPGVASPPLTVVVPARDSRSAAVTAMRSHPGFTAGPVAKVRRK